VETVNQAAPKATGWAGALGLAVVTGLFGMGYAGLLILLPLSLMLVALPPRRPGLIVVGLLGAALLLRGPADSLTDFARGWSLLVGAWFLVAYVAIRSERFFGRALAAVAAGVLTLVSAALVSPEPFARLDAAVRTRLTTGFEPFLATASGMEGGAVLVEAIRQGARVHALLFPALVAISSLAGLAVAWWLYRRVATSSRDGLAPLSEFRFADGMVWLLIAGLLLVVFPVGDLAARAGSNLMAFMGTLFALRGLGVLLVLAGMPGPLGLTLAFVVGLLLYPMVMAATFVIGLSDIWLDIRRRWAAARPPAN
jgi:hypothetical protein